MEMIFRCYSFKQPKAWVDSKLLCKWLVLVFPRVSRGSERGLIIWDSHRAHISEAVKAHCKSINVDMAVIPGGITSYLRAGDLCYYKRFKDKLNSYIEEWKDGPNVEYTHEGNPRPPKPITRSEWVRKTWSSISEDLIKKGLVLAGYLGDVRETFLARHDVYGDIVMDAWNELQHDRSEGEVLPPQVVEHDDDVFLTRIVRTILDSHRNAFSKQRSWYLPKIVYAIE